MVGAAGGRRFATTFSPLPGRETSVVSCGLHVAGSLREGTGSAGGAQAAPFPGPLPPLPVVASGLDGQATLKEEDGAASGKDTGGAGDCGCGTRPCYEVGVLEGPGPHSAQARFDAWG